MKQLHIVLFVFISTGLFAQYTGDDKEYIEETFTEVEKICTADNGQLWGLNMNLPLMIIDKKSREIIANKPDVKGLLTKRGNVFTGVYPDNKPIGNSITEFGGVIYALVEYPFPFPKSS